MKILVSPGQPLPVERSNKMVVLSLTASLKPFRFGVKAVYVIPFDLLIDCSTSELSAI